MLYLVIITYYKGGELLAFTYLSCENRKKGQLETNLFYFTTKPNLLLYVA